MKGKNHFIVGLSYKTAPVELRRQAAVQASTLRCAGRVLPVRGQWSGVSQGRDYSGQEVLLE